MLDDEKNKVIGVFEKKGRSRRHESSSNKLKENCVKMWFLASEEIKQLVLITHSTYQTFAPKKKKLDIWMRLTLAVNDIGCSNWLLNLHYINWEPVAQREAFRRNEQSGSSAESTPQKEGIKTPMETCKKNKWEGGKKAQMCTLGPDRGCLFKFSALPRRATRRPRHRRCQRRLDGIQRASAARNSLTRQAEE